MQLENLGHESWLIYTTNSSMLIDPLLNNEFGCNADYQFAKSSHAVLKEDSLKEVGAVLLTTDHFQHYDISSLEKLKTNINLYISESFSIENIIELKNKGFNPIICKYGQLIIYQDMEFVFVPSDENTYFWDSRVCSLMIASKKRDDLKKQWVFLQSDTKININIQKWIPSDWEIKPRIVILVCHYREYKEHGYSHWDNYISHPLKLDTEATSIAFLSDLFPIEIYPLNIATSYIMSGGEYERMERQRPNPTLDNIKIARFINKILVNSQVFVAKPGVSYSTFDPTTQKDSIHSKIKINDYSEVPIQEPFYVESKKNEFNQADQLLIEKGLKHLEKSFLFSKLGHQLLFTNDYLGFPINSERFIIKLLNGEEYDTYVFCFSKGKFLKTNSNDEDLFRYPSGIVVDKMAFLDIIRRKTSPTEALTNNIIQWYIGSIEESPLALFYSAFSKLVFPKYLT